VIWNFRWARLIGRGPLGSIRQSRGSGSEAKSFCIRNTFCQLVGGHGVWVRIRASIGMHWEVYGDFIKVAEPITWHPRSYFGLGSLN